MESGEVKVTEDLMSRGEGILVEINGEVNVAEEGKSLDSSITEHVKVRKRANHDGLGMETRESEGEKENRVKRGKGLGNGIVEEGGLENGKGDVDMEENGGGLSAVEEGEVMEEDKDSSVEGFKETDVSSSAEALKAHCSGRKEVEEGNVGGEREGGNDSGMEKSKVEIEGKPSRAIRQSRLVAMEKIEKLCVESDYDEDEEISKRGKKKGKRKKNNNGTPNGVGDKDNIAQTEDEKSTQRRSLGKKGTGEGEGKQLIETVTKTRVGLKRDEKVGTIGKKNNNGTSNGVGDKDNIAQTEDEKSTQRRSLRKKGNGEGEGRELNETVTKTRVGLKRDENGFLESKMCHQCQRNDKGDVVRCTKCKTKRYCLPCMETWYVNASLVVFLKDNVLSGA